MNSLSWIIYLADLVDGVGNMLAVCIGVSLVGFVGGVIAAGVTSGGPNFRSYHDESDRASMAAFYAWWQSAAKRTLKIAPWTFVAAFVAQAVLPSQSTVYAIAASEMGESALNSETGGKAVKALNAWLDRQIAGEGDSK